MPELTVADAWKIIIDNRELLESKIRESIKFKIRKVIPKAKAADLVSDAMTNTMERLTAGKVTFTDEKKLIGYLLYSCWFNYRDANKKLTIKGQSYEDWELEGQQLMGRDNARFFTLEAAAQELETLATTEPQDSSEQDKSDTYYAQLCEKVFIYLETCVTNRELSFRDVGLFKMYTINGYSGAKVLAHESGFSIDICRNAITKIKKRLLSVRIQTIS